MPGLPKDVNVITKFYANVQSLARKAHQTGLVDDPTCFEQFLQAFTCGKSFFDVVDVGNGPGKIRFKMSGKLSASSACNSSSQLTLATTEQLRVHISDYKCHHIFIGCSTNDPHQSLFSPYLEDPISMSRMTLIKGPESPRADAVPINSITIDLFRTTKLSDDLNGWIQPFPPPKPIGTPLIGTRILPTNYTPPARSSSVSPFSSAVKPFSSSRRGTDTTFNTDMSSAAPSVADSQAEDQPPKKSSAWAKVAERGHITAEAEAAKTGKKAAAMTKASSVPSLKPEQLLAQGIIPRNRHGQRIDPPCVEYDKNEILRLRRAKMCNVHYLKGNCPFGDKCTHDHQYPATKEDLKRLELVARLQPCNSGPNCDDVGCIYGHRCIVAVKRGMEDLKGVKNCFMLEDCRFDAAAHGIDTTIVKMSKV